MSFVLDCSISLAWCFDDERTQPVLDVLEQVVGGYAMVPVLWRFEFANGLLVAQRRKRIDAELRGKLLSQIGQLDIREDELPRAQQWAAVSALAERFGLSAYDAAYLELAQRRGLALATLDDALRRAAPQAGVTLTI